MLFGALQAKIQIRKLPTIVGSFRIRVFHYKRHVCWCCIISVLLLKIRIFSVLLAVRIIRLTRNWCCLSQAPGADVGTGLNRVMVGKKRRTK